MLSKHKWSDFRYGELLKHSELGCDGLGCTSSHGGGPEVIGRPPPPRIALHHITLTSQRPSSSRDFWILWIRSNRYNLEQLDINDRLADKHKHMTHPFCGVFVRNIRKNR